MTVGPSNQQGQYFRFSCSSCKFANIPSPMLREHPSRYRPGTVISEEAIWIACLLSFVKPNHRFNGFSLSEIVLKISAAKDGIVQLISSSEPVAQQRARRRGNIWISSIAPLRYTAANIRYKRRNKTRDRLLVELSTSRIPAILGTNDLIWA